MGDTGEAERREDEQGEAVLLHEVSGNGDRRLGDLCRTLHHVKELFSTRWILVVVGWDLFEMTGSFTNTDLRHSLCEVDRDVNDGAENIILDEHEAFKNAVVRRTRRSCWEGETPGKPRKLSAFFLNVHVVFLKTTILFGKNKNSIDKNQKKKNHFSL